MAQSEQSSSGEIRFDMSEKSRLVALWSTFLKTSFGHWLKEHTQVVYTLGQNDDKSTKMLVWIVLLFSCPFLVVFLLTWSGAALFVFLLALLIWSIAACIFWYSYKGSVQQDQDYFDTNPFLMSRAEVKYRLSGWALSKEANHALPGIRKKLDDHDSTRGAPIAPRLAGVPIGYCHDEKVWLSTERGIYVLETTRSGKTTRIVIPLIMESPGAVIATSSRSDIVDVTFNLRKNGYMVPGDAETPDWYYASRPVYIFDPTDIIPADSKYAAYKINWDPVAACRDMTRAQSLAASLVSSVGLSGENQIWEQSGVQIIQSLLLAGAIKGVGFETVYNWSRSETGPNAAYNILSESKDANVRDWAQPLYQLRVADSRTRSNMMLTVTNAFNAMSLPNIRESLHFNPHKPSFDMAEFLRSKGVVYLLSPLRSTQGGSESNTGMFGNMFLAEARDTARKLAFESPSGKLEPSLSLVLDEVVNITPWEGIPQLFTAGAGDGIQTVVVAQSRAQMRARFGEGEEKQMWDNSQKLIGSGLSSQDILKEISELSGEHETKHEEHSWGGMPMAQQGMLGRLGTMERVNKKATLSVDAVRRIPQDRCLLVTSNIRPAAVRLIPYWKRGWEACSFKPPSNIDSERL